MIGVSIAVPEPYGSLLQQRRAGFGDLAAHAIPSHVTLLPPTEVGASALHAVRPRIWPPSPRRAGRSRCGWRAPARSGHCRRWSMSRSPKAHRSAPHCRSTSDPARSCGQLEFPYHPHVTVAHGIPQEAMDRAQRELADFTAVWTVTGFSFYEQGGDGVWRTLCEYPFGRPPGAAPGVPQQQCAARVDAVGRIP